MDEIQLKQFYANINKHLSFLDNKSDDASGDETVNLIIQTINKYSHSPFIKKCVAIIDKISNNDLQFCKNLFDIACNLVKYQIDPEGHEIVFTPKLLVQVGKGDCKKITVFICSILKCKGIDSCAKVVNYDSAYGWQHIYAIAFYPNDKGYLTLDPVNKQQWNTEVKHRISRLNYYNGSQSQLQMGNKLSLMGNIPGTNQKFLGIGQSADAIFGDLEEISGRPRFKTIVTPKTVQEIEEEYIEGLGYDSIEGTPDDDLDTLSGPKKQARKEKRQAVKAKRKAEKPKRKEKRKKIFKKAKSAGFAPVRAAFLLLIKAGQLVAKTPLKFNLALKLAEAWQKDGGKALKEIWGKFGGKPDVLKKAIIKASKVQIQSVGNNTYSISGVGAVEAGVIIAAITAATPILVLVIKMLHDKAVLKKQQALDATKNAEDMEDKNTNEEGDQPKPKGGKSPIEIEAEKEDEGGDEESQKIIKASKTKTDDSQSEGESSESSDSSSQSKTPQAGGFNLLNASSWFNGAIIVPLMASAINNPLINKLGAITSTFLLLGGITLIIKSKSKKIKVWQI